MKKPYRENVGAVLIRDGEFLLCKHLHREDVWQFPQGGLEVGESHFEAVWREIEEELGIANPRALMEVVCRAPATTYDFPPGDTAAIAERFRGQRQTLFVIKYLGADDDIDLASHEEPEFSAFEWYSREDALEKIWPIKRKVFEVALATLDDYEAGTA